MTFSVHWAQFVARWLLFPPLRPNRAQPPLTLALFALLAAGSVAASTRPALAQSLAPTEGPSNVGSEPAPEVAPRGLITIESDTQSADNVTGVVTAAGNVRIVYPSRGMVATARQAQYFSQEGRLVLTGDVDIVQDGGNALRAERVVYLLEQERAEAEPTSGQQVFSQMVIQSGRPMPTPLTP